MVHAFGTCNSNDVRAAPIASLLWVAFGFIWCVFQVFALVSLALALLPVGYLKSMPLAKEGLTSTVGFQV
jgi:hypothetical protein